MGGRGASSNRNSRMNFTFKKQIITPSGESIPAGTKVTNIVEIAGGKRKRDIDDINRIVKKYGGDRKHWSKRRGTVFIAGAKREIHYYQHDRIGKIEIKLK